MCIRAAREIAQFISFLWRTGTNGIVPAFRLKEKEHYVRSCYMIGQSQDTIKKQHSTIDRLIRKLFLIY